VRRGEGGLGVLREPGAAYGVVSVLQGVYLLSGDAAPSGVRHEAVPVVL
jgi:hypothetical protein